MTMKRIFSVLAISLLLAGGCSKTNTPTNTATPSSNAAVTNTNELTPEQLGELGAQIKKNPNDAQRLLTEKGLDEKTFEQAIRKVSEDPAASQRYAEAYKKASA